LSRDISSSIAFSPFNIIMPACAVNYPTSTILMIDHIERVVEISLFLFIALI
jgi:hypothetical protein